MAFFLVAHIYERMFPDNLTSVSPEDSVQMAFSEAAADFNVEKIRCSYEYNGFDRRPSAAHSIIRTDTGAELGYCSDTYEVITNRQLLRLAIQAVRQGAELEQFHVFKGGKRLAFSAKLPESEVEVVPGDRVYTRFVGILGHDKLTAGGGFLCNHRVFCDNQFRSIYANSMNYRIPHQRGANDRWEQMIESLDLAKHRFNIESDQSLYKDAAGIPFTKDDFDEVISEVYKSDLFHADGSPKLITVEGTETLKREMNVGDLRQYDQLIHAYHNGLGIKNMPSIQGTAWAAWNALTEVTASAANSIRPFERFAFAQGRDVSTRIADCMKAVTLRLR